MKRTIAATALAALLAGGAANAQPLGHGAPGGFGLLALDANADGKVTRAEFDTSQRARFAAIDANGDGFATPEEFRASHEKQRAARQAEMAGERFAKLDTDGNGQISKAEFAAAKPPGPDGGRDGAKGRPGGAKQFAMGGREGGREGRRDGPDGKPARLGPDADADGKVNLAEFSARGVEAFTRADTNKDGAVTIAELQAALPMRR